MKTFTSLALAALLALSVAAPASATQYLTGGIGTFDFNRASERDTMFDLEWRGNTFWYGLLPVVGAFVNSDNGAYAYAGVNYDWEFAPNFFLVPGFAVGAWHEGDSAHLGGVLEFRSGIELDYKFYGEWRAGVRIEHLSNAGIYDHNPGEESALFTVSVPLGY